MQSTPYCYIICFKVADHMVCLPATDVIIFEASAKYVYIVTRQEKYMIRITMADLEKGLVPQIFCRIHRSYIINWQLVSKIYKDHVIIDGKSVPLSLDCAPLLMQRFIILN